MRAPFDALGGAAWVCRPTPPGAITAPDQLPDNGWYAARVPGTAAAALRSAGAEVDSRDFDAEDWWFRVRFERPPDGEGPWRLRFGGLATIADVWLNGEHLLHSDNMYLPQVANLATLQPDNDLAIRFAALGPLLAQKRPRPRWKVARLSHQTLRWFRATLLGRLVGWTPTPAPVGPWRPVTLTVRQPIEVLAQHVHATCDPDGAGGSVRVELQLAHAAPAGGMLRVGDMSAPLDVDERGLLTGMAHLDTVDRWWPHTHGDQPRYPVRIEFDGRELDLGRVGFRTIEVDRTDGDFRIVVNGVAAFCRGACWLPLDPVSLVDDVQELTATLEQFRAANLNMLRIGGETVYPSDEMLELLDQLGILLWQDCMFAFYDLPDDPALTASIEAELTAVFATLRTHPCLALISGGSEIEQQAALVGIPASQRAMSAFETIIPALVRAELPGVAYIQSSPTGGTLPIQPRTGVAHYYGVGAYLRDPDDARRAGVRFSAESLAFGTPPEPATINQACGGAAGAGHHPGWKRAVYRDAGSSWDFEDVRDHYTRRLFGVEPRQVRWTDPERGLELGRAAVAHLFERVWSEWRRPSSPCRGALVFYYRDLAPGAGLGVVDALGRPKAPWYVMRRVLAPTAVLITDEGLNGLDAHVLNDSATELTATLRVELFAHGELCVETADQTISLAGRGGTTIDLTGMFDGFRDLSYAHRFGPPSQDIVAATLLDADGAELGQAVHLAAGVRRATEPDLGLSARAERDADDTWWVTVTTRRFAQWVALDMAGFVAEDSWFHLLPGRSRALRLWPERDALPRGAVRALNCSSATRISL